MSKLLFCLLFLLIAFSCKKENSYSCFKVKYVDGFCYTHIYQIVSPEFQHLGQLDWVRPSDGKVFQNVFVLENFCEDLSSTYQSHDSTFFVRLLSENEPKNISCITCLALHPSPPSKKLAIQSFACNE